ncbi:MAG: hypothetical protein ACI3T9_04050 [Romboutsia timonensis]
MSRENKLYIVSILVLTYIMGLVMKEITSNEIARRVTNEEQYIMVEEQYD